MLSGHTFVVYSGMQQTLTSMLGPAHHSFEPIHALHRLLNRRTPVCRWFSIAQDPPTNPSPADGNLALTLKESKTIITCLSIVRCFRRSFTAIVSIMPSHEVACLNRRHCHQRPAFHNGYNIDPISSNWAGPISVNFNDDKL